MSNVVPFRGKKFSENLAQRILDAEIDASLIDAGAAYANAMEDIRNIHREIIGKNQDAINKAIDSGSPANEELI